MEKTNSIVYTKDSFEVIYSRFSHEIRNPLSIISSELRLLSERHPEVAGFEEWDTIQDNLQYLQELLQEFSDYNNAGKLFSNPTDIRAYLQDVVRTVQPFMDYLNIALTLQTPGDLPVLSIDRIKMRQVLLNLMRNAQDAIPDSGGRIDIYAIRTDDRHLCISVTDNGCGIPPEQLSDIFTPFVSFKKNGTGLGLSIARQIIEAHQGTITAKSTLGKGTVFYIVLPCGCQQNNVRMNPPRNPPT